jgi:phenylacetate-CoA ligase
MKLDGGILGRLDDMIIVRGVNLYPSAVDQLVRGLQGIAEYRVEIRTVKGLTELELKIEPAAKDVDTRALRNSLEEAFRRGYNLRVPVTVMAPGELPRFELKAKRWIRL